MGSRTVGRLREDVESGSQRLPRKEGNNRNEKGECLYKKKKNAVKKNIPCPSRTHLYKMYAHTGRRNVQV